MTIRHRLLTGIRNKREHRFRSNRAKHEPNIQYYEQLKINAQIKRANRNLAAALDKKKQLKLWRERNSYKSSWQQKDDDKHYKATRRKQHAVFVRTNPEYRKAYAAKKTSEWATKRKSYADDFALGEKEDRLAKTKKMKSEWATKRKHYEEDFKMGEKEDRIARAKLQQAKWKYQNDVRNTLADLEENDIFGTLD